MKKSDLFEAVRAWLYEQELDAKSDMESNELHFRGRGTSGECSCRLICEEAPLLLQVLCLLPFRVPEARQAKMALLLHELNAATRLGAFCLHDNGSAVSFRLSTPIWAEAPIETQVNQAVGVALGTVGEVFAPLAEFAFSNCSVEHSLGRIATSEEPQLRLPGNRIAGRPELN